MKSSNDIRNSTWDYAKRGTNFTIGFSLSPVEDYKLSRIDRRIFPLRLILDEVTFATEE